MLRSMISRFKSDLEWSMLAGLAAVTVNVAVTPEALTQSIYTGSAAIRDVGKGFLYFNNGNCVNTTVYQTANGQIWLVGRDESLFYCQRATGKVSGTPKHISYMIPWIGHKAVAEIADASEYTFGTSRANLLFAPIIADTDY